ncbi:hypothetical protein MMC24_002059 [Lignoscripta atroalba]|nr:hypothetical protein [Lignoscripta atroalba]
MPLSELSINHIGRNGLVNDASQSPTSTSAKTHDPPVGRQSTFLPAPSSVQSMLKNTTETGDVGLFSIKPTRIPHPISQVSPRWPSGPPGQYNLPQENFAQHQDHSRQYGYREGDERHSSIQSYRGTTASSVISMYQSESQKSFPPRPQPFENDSHRAFSMSQSSHISYNLSNHQSYGTLRPRSPFVYPTRLKRPGYRPSSPALSEFNGTDARTNFRLERGASFRTTSPLSLYPVRRVPLGYHQDSNRAGPTFQSSPSPSLRSRSRARKAPPTPIRGATPRPPSSNSVRSSVHEPPSQQRCDHGWRYRQPQSPSPLYYDYTEAFEEQQHYHSANTTVLSLVEQPTPEREMSEELFELEGDIGCTHLAELPVQSSASVKPLEEHIGGTGSHTPDIRSDSQPSRMSKEAIQEATQDLGVVGNMPENISNQSSIHPPDSKASLTDPVGRRPSTSRTVGHHILTSSKPRFRNISLAGSNHIVGDLDKSLSFVTPHQLRNESTDPLESIPKVQGKDRVLVRSSTDTEMVKEADPSIWKTSSPKFSRLDMLRKAESIPEPRQIRAASSDGLAEFEKPTILSPVPERSMSSQSHHNRFSRIFSIDDSLNDLPTVIKNAETPSRPNPSPPSAGIDSFVGIGSGASSSRSFPRPPGSSRRSLVPLSIPEMESDVHKGDMTATGPKGPVERLGLGNKSMNTTISAARINDGSHSSGTRSTLIDQGGTTITYRVEPQQVNIKANPDSSLENHCISSVSSSPQLMKELPPLPRDSSNMLFSPPTLPTDAVLPFAFTPLVSIENEAAVGRQSDRTNTEREGELALTQKNKEKVRSDVPSIASSLSLRPWNLETNYPWMDQSKPVQEHTLSPNQDDSKATSTSPSTLPKFKVKITRASTSTKRTSIVANQTAAHDLALSHSAATSNEFPRTEGFARNSRFHSAMRNNTGSEPMPMRTRFTEVMDSRPTTALGAKLGWSSPGPNFAEVRSFFSDDSSQMQNKGSIRQRLSQLKAIASRANSSDDVRGPDRGLIASALGRSRSSGQNVRSAEDPTVGMSNFKYKKWQMMGKLRKWWHRGEERLRELSQRMKRDRKQKSERTNLYAGV